MTAVFAAVLLCSFGLNRLFSPAGDAVARAVDSRPVTVTGTIAAQPMRGRFVLRTEGASYVLSDTPAVRPYAGRAVRITGILHQSPALLEIRKIAPLLDQNHART